MNAERYQKLKHIFHRSAEIAAAGERADFLRRECDDSEMRGEIEKMLAAADSPDDTLEKNAFEVLTNGKYSKIPERIGAYKIVREIGRGGMGAVYEAVRETDDFRQRAAVKIIKRGMDTDAVVARFRHEQKILASLEHPFIARFLDGGMTGEGLPFYAMEYVEGEPLDDYCAARNLSIEEKLKIFRQICEAVQYAHQNLVVHRDLKPKNILVRADGTPKLLDFGIGKILAADAEEEAGTATALGMMTPAYASPEQIRGERIGTASDIYSLGVVLYELLTRHKPYKINSKSQLEIERAILESEPVKPSAITNYKLQITKSKKIAVKDETNVSKTQNPTINPKSKIQNPKSLRGDLDNIVLKALRKEISERYVSIGQFSEDVRRHLEGLPIMARPHTFSYRAAKFIKRNRAGVLAAGLIFASLCAGIAAALWQARRAENQRVLAEKRFAEVRQIANSVVFKYTDAISGLPNSAEVREMLLRDASDYLDRLARDADDDLALQRELAAAYVKLGDVRGRPHAASLGDTAGAIASYEKAAPLLENVYLRAAKEEKPAIAAELVTLYRELATAFSRANQHTPQRSLYIERMHAVIEETAREFPENATFRLESVRLKTSEAERRLENNYDDGERVFREQILPLLAELEKTPEGESHAAKVYNELAWRSGEHAKLLTEARGESARARQIFETALEYALREERIKLVRFERDAANLKLRRGVAVGLTNAAIALHNLDRYDEALERLEKSLRLKEELAAFDGKNIQAVFDTGTVYSEIGIVRFKQREFAAALEYYAKALACFDRVIATDSENYEAIYYKIDVLGQAAAAHAAAGNVEKSMGFFRQAEDLSLRIATPDESEIVQRAKIYLRRGAVYAAGKPESRDAARRDLEKAREILLTTDTARNALLIEIVEKELAALLNR